MAETMEPPCPSTPSRGSRSRIRTPPAPQFGTYSDHFEPYSPPRKSSRIAQRNSDRTPSPKVSSRTTSEKQQQQQQQQQRNSQASPKTATRKQVGFATPFDSPQKKRMPAMESNRRASGSLTASSTATAAAALGLPAPSNADLLSTRATTSSVAGMLITPAKTPQKPPTEESKAKVDAFARTLFINREEEIMPSPRKVRGKKYTLDSFSEDAADEPIPIFTDSHERIPEVDHSSDNPFIVAPSHPTSAAVSDAPRRSKRHMVSIPGEGKISVEEAIQREDGMLITFRGKKQFRKFVNDESSPGLDEGEGGLGGAVETSRQRLTRSAIKRVLFPVTKVRAPVPEITIEDEEAVTDIEDHVLAGLEEKEEEEPVTPAEPVKKAPGTPEAPKFTPASPPTTVRTTRVTKKTLEAPKPKAAGRSPFDSWKRTKGSSSTASSLHQKRPGDHLPAGPSKRTRA
ncbi:hypothetical protein QBC35DRAFT_54835 [Podospora australis]|uniref:Uncharacterized protein n=1 Tax=Podospora australis TaxID=1536484 RepID=A0AAN6X3K4_9PEZI|nr:hypothetical protein QBC35DRAFT_54835 [Podospora australis]